MLKHPKSIREITLTKYNFFINPHKKINFKSTECDENVFEKKNVKFFLNYPVRLQFNIEPYIHSVATQIITKFPSLFISDPGIKNEPAAGILFTLVNVISVYCENCGHTGHRSKSRAYVKI